MKRSCFSEILCNPRKKASADGQIPHLPDGPTSLFSVHPETVRSFGMHQIGDERAVKQAADAFKSEGSSETFSASCPEDIVNHELRNLSPNEREQVYESIHGVTRVIEESANFVEDRLEELDRKLKSKSKINTAYSRALFLNKKYVKARDFELMFLRSTEYDAGKAADKIMLHFEKKWQWFGHEKLTNDIRWDDLDDDAKESTRHISALFPNMTDSVGRPIMFGPYALCLPDPHAACHVQASWHKMFSCAKRSETAQKKGFVTVMFSHGASAHDTLEAFRMHENQAWLQHCMPFRNAAVHICLSTEILRPLIVVCFRLASPQDRQRMKMHYGSMLETHYDLNTFGIPTSIMPMDTEGIWRLDLVDQHLRELIRYEKDSARVEEISRDGKIHEIREVDVLVGKGPQFQWFPGNVDLTNLIKECKSQHQAASRLEKKHVVAGVLQQIKARGARFLERYGDTGWWVEVDEHRCTEKIAMGFRNLTKRAKEKQQPMPQIR